MELTSIYKRRNKKAVSALVATVLLILITVATSSIIWAVVPGINKILQLNDACLNARLMIETKGGYTCYNEGKHQVNIMVSRGPEDYELSEIQLGVTQQAMKKSYVIKEDTSVVLSMSFEEGEGAITNDASGNANDGAVSGADWTKGMFGYGLDFDGENDYVLIKDSASLDSGEGITIEAWIKIDEIENLSLANFIVVRD